MKTEKFQKLLEEISKCDKCLNLGNKSLINFYHDADLASNIPSIWTDWFNRLDSRVFIIGQDWGPFEDMRLLYERFVNGESYNYLIDQEKSLTKRNLEKFLSNINISLDNVFVTNAIMCARCGNLYRGNNIDLKYSTECCAKFLERQIDIVKPKIILTLGYYPLYSLSKIFNFEIEDNLSKTIDKYNIFRVSNYIIIPMFHPASQVSHEKQIERYKIILDCL